MGAEVSEVERVSASGGAVAFGLSAGNCGIFWSGAVGYPIVLRQLFGQVDDRSLAGKRQNLRPIPAIQI